MADFLGLMKQAAQLQSKMQAMQAELDQIEVAGTAGGGVVTVTLSAKGDLKGVKIDDSLLKPSEKEIIEDLIVAAHAAALETAMEKIEVCKVCGNIDTQNPCTVCTDGKRDVSIIVVVADVADLWALERAHAVNGRYHVLGGTLSPLDGVGPQDLSIDALISRAHETPVKEVILALNATVDGQTTAHYITELLADAKVKVTRLAHGVPVGGELDYLDEGTLAAAIKQRTLF